MDEQETHEEYLVRQDQAEMTLLDADVIEVVEWAGWQWKKTPVPTVGQWFDPEGMQLSANWIGESEKASSLPDFLNDPRAWAPLLRKLLLLGWELKGDSDHVVLRRWDLTTRAEGKDIGAAVFAAALREARK